jgi:hypothetical protein
LSLHGRAFELEYRPDFRARSWLSAGRRGRHDALYASCIFEIWQCRSACSANRVAETRTLLVSQRGSALVPFDLIENDADIVIAVDVVGAPAEAERKSPTSIDLMFGATQLMMQSIIAHKLKHRQPHILIRPPVSKYRVLDFMKIEALMTETAAIKDELKREVERVVEGWGGAARGKRGKHVGG